MVKYGMAMAAMEAFGRPLIEDNKPNQKDKEPIKKPKKGGMMMACRHLVKDIIEKDNP